MIIYVTPCLGIKKDHHWRNLKNLSGSLLQIGFLKKIHWPGGMVQRHKARPDPLALAKYAAKCLPFLKALPSPTSAIMARAEIGPTPSIFCSRLQVSLFDDSRCILRS